MEFKVGDWVTVSHARGSFGRIVSIYDYHLCVKWFDGHFINRPPVDHNADTYELFSVLPPVLVELYLSIYSIDDSFNL